MTDVDAKVLRRYLELQGRRVPLQRIIEQLGPEPSPDAIATGLGRLGLPARIVAMSASTARFLPQPLLVFTATRRLALVRSIGGIGGGRFELEGHDGVLEQLDAQQLEAVSAGRALQVEASAVPDSLGGLARHVLSTTGGSLRILLAAALLAAAAALLGPLGTKLVFDNAIPDANRSLLGLAGLALLAIALHRAVLGMIRDAAARSVHARAMELWLSKIIDRVLRLPFRELAQQSTSERAQVIHSAETVLRTCTESTLVPTLDGMFAVLFLALIAWQMPELALLIALVCAALTVAAQSVAARCAKLAELALEADRCERQRLMDLVHGADTIKASGAVEHQTASWLQTLVDAQHRALAAERLAALLGAASALVYRRLMPLAALVWAGAGVLSGALSIGTLVAVLQAVYSLGDSVARLNDVSVRLWGIRGDLRRVRAALATPVDEVAEVAMADTSANAVSMDNVAFRYGRSSKWTLRGYSLHVRRGTLHHLTGESGCGKTTVLRLLAGLYRPELGTVTINGVDAHDARSHIAYLPQTARLVQGTIHDNLRLLSGGATDQRIAAAAAATGLDVVLASWPMGLETIVPAGAASLSGGQRQLIALTACVASSRPIVLLDEAFAHIDPVAREGLDLDALFLREGRTVIAVTHERQSARRERLATSSPRQLSAATSFAPLERIS